MAKDKMTTETENAELKTEDINKVRDLLFGARMHDYEQRFQMLEERISSESKRVFDALNIRLDNLQSSFQQRISEMENNCASKHQGQIDNIAEVRQNLQNAIEDFRHEIKKIEQQTLFQKLFGTDPEN